MHSEIYDLPDIDDAEVFGFMNEKERQFYDSLLRSIEAKQSARDDQMYRRFEASLISRKRGQLIELLMVAAAVLSMCGVAYAAITLRDQVIESTKKMVIVDDGREEQIAVLKDQISEFEAQGITNSHLIYNLQKQVDNLSKKTTPEPKPRAAWHYYPPKKQSNRVKKKSHKPVKKVNKQVKPVVKAEPVAPIIVPPVQPSETKSVLDIDESTGQPVIKR